MGWFSKLTGQAPAAEPAAPVAFRPMGLYLGCAVTFDPLFNTVLGERALTGVPEGTQFVEAVGTIDLGEGVVLHRFYLTDDVFIQVSVENEQVTDSKVFAYLEGIDPNDRAHFEQFLRAGSRLGQPTYTAEGVTFQREWGEDPQAWAPPLCLTETVTKKTGSHPLTLYPMLYQRTLPEKDRPEYLMVTGEDVARDDFCVSVAVGVDVSTADFTVI